MQSSLLALCLHPPPRMTRGVQLLLRVWGANPAVSLRKVRRLLRPPCLRRYCSKRWPSRPTLRPRLRWTPTPQSSPIPQGSIGLDLAARPNFSRQPCSLSCRRSECMFCGSFVCRFGGSSLHDGNRWPLRQGKRPARLELQTAPRLSPYSQESTTL